MDYSASITVAADPQSAAQAIRKEMHIWWSNRVELNGEGATIRFNNSHATFAFDPEDTALLFEWPCTDAHMIIEDVEDAAEWLGTALVWSVEPSGTGSQITLTHRGLNQTLACLDVCTRGWEHFFEGSLRNHLNGQPATPETST
ncbi:MAG: hypothetical protein AAGL89_10170 [Pseudomonadota bacterium]